jgi:uncharacterized protein (TIGR02147 family)
MKTEPVEPTQALDFRRFLQEELVRRIKVNPRFSLRAFALHLDVQSGFLSKILLGQRRVTPATVRRFGVKLGLNLQQIEAYERACGGETSEPNFRQIAYDHFQIISDWYHFAILELAALDNFEPNVRWIAKALGITTAEAQAAVERLIRLDYLLVTPKGTWKVRDGFTTTLGTEETGAALQQMQKQVLEMAIKALETVPVNRRDQSTMTMAIDSSRLPAAKDKVKKFRRELCAFLEGGKTKDNVYQLSISLYPLTQFDD